MTIEEILKKRKQTYKYNSEKYPDKLLVENLLKKTYEYVPSRQNLMPYKVHILGPEKKEYKEEFYKLTTIPPKNTTACFHNTNTMAPYLLILTLRLCENPNSKVKNRIKMGDSYPLCDSKLYRSNIPDVCIEIGMFCTTLTSLCIANNIDISYVGCFPKWDTRKPEIKNKWKCLPFIDDYPLLSMQLGYRCGSKYKDGLEIKPDINEIINWL